MPKLANSPAAHDRPANQVHSHTPADLSPHEFDDCLSAIPLIPVSDPAPNNILALGPTSSFRNVSACHRCRLRKHRCDQQLPQCQPCEKAGLRCVGYDLITKQEIPRSYVYFLEHRVNYLEKVLVDHNISFKPAVAYDEDEIEGSGCSFDVVFSQNNPGSSMAGTALEKSERVPRSGSVRSLGKRERSMDAVRKPGGNSACHDSRGNGLQTGTDEAKIIRDSFFGLQAGKSGRACTSLPERDIANELVDVYFEYVNPHMPVLHRDDFMTLLHDVYSTREDFSPYSLFFIYIVYAIGSGVVHDTRTPLAEKNLRGWRLSSGFGDRKRQKVSEQEYKPEEYYSSAMFHLEVSLGSQCQKGEVGRLQELQAVLLLASFALVRPGVPSLGYIARVAVDLAVDLGFQNENGSSRGATHDTHLSGQPSHKDRTAHSDCNLDLRRRLWWCVYSLDRLITPYTGRPFSIPDQIITTDFPSCFDDKYISKSGLISPPDNLPSYKLVACHFFKLRKLQSEIHDVFYHERTICQASLSSAGEKRHSLFLRGFESLASWQKNMLRRLNHWRISVPSAEATGVRFPILYMELDYWNSIIMLYRRNFVDPNELLKSSNSTSSRLRRQQFCGKNEDEHRICLAVAEAGQNVLHIHRIMRQGRFAYFTYLASQSIFQASKCLSTDIVPLIRNSLHLSRQSFPLCNLAFTTGSQKIRMCL
ncbi:C6 transcription factor [Penicillium lagena]|uniref:C6 transcription factor n=1 Tax=Penicillium lagena TaxID=94218 RepID=UPI0025412B6A|nr:C6 transcription factor [Penicillium lagena]KAJ5613307.1 C6 transcription factor [Penicillium lagena]